ncbi:Major facilitator superfamily domain, general substrate transporter [Akanthomyces lecanii RCEF 1005]|uniref:Major facilitator superfamily domain, general substrate transporter n=1 Tax=Akanthomyces lecanii RCEF 1005 TaxID=1081108 RepID=A0A168JQM4_CORDF|nr:Major facilitator superfamily domain, general substrate transporter [Akanthomyces lecanii RCEF 1005]
MPEMTQISSGKDSPPTLTLTAEQRRTSTLPPPDALCPVTSPVAIVAEKMTQRPLPSQEVPENEATQYDEEVRRGMAAMNAAFDWTGPSDPDNPRNFPLAFRVCSAAALTLLAMVATVVGAMYAPAQDAVASALHTSRQVAVLPLSLYNLGLACGPLVGAPLSETYGRRAVVLGTAPVFMLLVLGAALSASAGGLIACRFFAGVFAAPLINNAPATMLDFTPTRYRGVVLGIYYTVPSFGASLGPLIGGFLVHTRGGWRWTQWAALILAAVFYLPVLLCTRETYKKIILRRRAVRLGLQDSASQRTSPGRAFRYFATTLVQRPLHMLFTEPIVALVSVYCGFLFALLYTFVVAVPWIFHHYYGFEEPRASLVFLGLIVGTLAAAVPLVGIDVWYYQPRLRRWQAEHQDEEALLLPSEHRLVGALAGSFLLPACLFASAWTAERRAHWMVPVALQGCVMLASILVYSSASLFMLDSYGPLYGASASGAMMMSRYVLSAAFPLFALQMYEALGVGWATTLLGCVTLAMAPIPWCFWIYGERIRKRSRYETSA